jgi:hypothetical protein
MARSVSYGAPHYAVCSSLLSSHFSSVLSTLFSNTLSRSSSLTARDKASHTYRTTGNITVLYILVFKFLSSRLRNQMLSTTRIESLLDFLRNPILISYCR